jgi:two-component system, LuxR family, sensor kinase FixL
LVSWVTVVWSMAASACLTLAGIYWLVWYRNRTAWAHLLFSVTAAATATFAFCELRIMRAQTTVELDAAIRWAQVPLFVLLVALIWFVGVYLDAGRRWLAWTFCAVRSLYLLPTVLAGWNVNYREITSLRRIQFLGEPVTVLNGVPSPVLLLGQSSILLLLVFVADASITAWRRGDRRKALMIGGSVEFFVLASLGSSILVIWANLQAPIVFSQLYLGLVAVMAYELSHDVLRASQLVDELRTSEAGLRESEARLSLTVDAADFGLFVQDLTRDRNWASERWRELFGFAPSAALESDAILQRLHPDDRDSLQRARAQAIAGADGGRYQTEYRLLMPDDATRWIWSLGRVECDAAGRPVLIRGASRDITTAKHAEREMQQLRQEITHAGRVTMMGQLASALAHEINQPLAAILSNAEAAERFLQLDTPNITEVRAILADIRSADKRAADVIDRMRRLLRRNTVDAQPLDVAALVGEVAALVRSDAAARHVKLNIDVPGALPAIRGDRVHLQQVLLNLILNGMDALNGAGPERRRVSVSARRDGGQSVEIAVGDGGHGIPADALGRIFDPFYTTKPDGMGMGLAISRTIVEAHGGKLWAENQDGGGAAFRFTVPIADAVDAA